MGVSQPRVENVRGKGHIGCAAWKPGTGNSASLVIRIVSQRSQSRIAGGIAQIDSVGLIQIYGPAGT